MLRNTATRVQVTLDRTLLARLDQHVADLREHVAGDDYAGGPYHRSDVIEAALNEVLDRDLLPIDLLDLVENARNARQLPSAFTRCHLTEQLPL